MRGICPDVATARAANRETDAMHLTVKDGSMLTRAKILKDQDCGSKNIVMGLASFQDIQ